LLHAATAIAVLTAVAACNNKEVANPPAQPAQPGGPAASSAPRLKIGYVLHGQNDFTQVIKKGAEDADKDLNAEVQVAGPVGFNAQDAIAMFDGMVRQKKDGIVVVPMPGQLWVTPIKQAVTEKIPVATANITSP